MKPALDYTLDYKRLVAEGYNTYADAYQQARGNGLPAAIKWLKNRLPNRARVLDIGCAAGVPVTRELSKRFVVTGVDISAEQIRRARQNVRHGEFFHSDILALDFSTDAFDAVVALYVLYHIPRGEHERLFRSIHRWLTPGGYLLVTLAREAEEGRLERASFGAEMFWSHYSLPEYRVLLTETGFEILELHEENPRYPLAICRRGQA
ncbi:MAG: class I SAM-dependent methyltransferase [Anaerolineales bacterium]|nr:class I SAM-dependent methyltransferase [Anaerolineales bacterium]MDW8279040.1 class I SAM-dependent methyltransferase [Anaerolineales bacterium]